MSSLFSPVNVTWINVLTSVPLALMGGLFIAVIYRRVMTNLSYSVPIQHTPRLSVDDRGPDHGSSHKCMHDSGMDLADHASA